MKYPNVIAGTVTGKLRSFCSIAAILATSAFVFTPTANAGVIVGWDFENASNGQVSGIAASTASAIVSAASFNTGNNGVETFAAPIGKLSLTRFFSEATFPSLTFTLSSAVSGGLSFTHYHNHNPGFPTTPQYEFDVQLSSDGGSTWADIGSNFVAKAATSGSTETISGLSFLAGTYSMRWIGNNFSFGTNSGTEFFGLNNVNLVPEPTTLAILGLGLAGIGFSRRKKAA